MKSSEKKTKKTKEELSLEAKQYYKIFTVANVQIHTGERNRNGFQKKQECRAVSRTESL